MGATQAGRAGGARRGAEPELAPERQPSAGRGAAPGFGAGSPFSGVGGLRVDAAGPESAGASDEDLPDEPFAPAPPAEPEGPVIESSVDDTFQPWTASARLCNVR